MFLVRFFQMGGFFMWPILLVLAVGIAIAVERWIHLNRAMKENRKMWDQLHPVLAEGDFDKAREMVNNDTSSSLADAGDGVGAPGGGQATGRHRNRHGREHDGDSSSIGKAHTVPGAALKYRHPVRTARHHHGSYHGLHRGCHCEPRREGRPARGQHFRGHELHCLWSDDRDPASPTPCPPDNNHGPDREQPGDGIGKGAQYYLQFYQAPD